MKRKHIAHGLSAIFPARSSDIFYMGCRFCGSLAIKKYYGIYDITQKYEYGKMGIPGFVYRIFFGFYILAVVIIVSLKFIHHKNDL